MLSFELLLQLVFLAALKIASGQGFSLNIFLLPVALGSLGLLSFGLASISAIAGYVVKDFQQVLDLFFMALLYLTPAMYSVESLPQRLRPFVLLNPFSHVIWMFRDVFASDSTIHWNSWMIVTALGAGLAATGFAAIGRIQQIVGDLV